MHDGMIEYFPCMVHLTNGEQHDCVYVVDAKSYIRIWGVWPDEDCGKRALAIQDVAQIHLSPSRLPVQFARQMYAVGESGMGYCIFTLQFADGTRQTYCTGNLIDFPELPKGKSVRDVVALSLNEGASEQSLGRESITGVCSMLAPGGTFSSVLLRLYGLLVSDPSVNTRRCRVCNS